jgi:hypothetical protein
MGVGLGLLRPKPRYRLTSTAVMVGAAVIFAALAGVMLPLR